MIDASREYDQTINVMRIELYFFFFKQKTAYEIAHGDGLAGSSFNYGFGAHTDWDWIGAVGEVLEHATLTTLLIPGIGTVHDLRHAYEIGVRSVRIATHCTEADIAKQHIDYARTLGMDV